MPATSWRAVGGKRLAFGGGALRGGGVSTPRRLPGGPGVLSPWSPAWPSRHRMTSIHALGFLSGEFPARLRVYVCIDVHGRDRVGHAIVAPGGRRVSVLGTIDCGQARLGRIARPIFPCLHA
ncbi:hydrolase, NUDIX family domain protein [Burkholderia pseudomallei MSHR5492]|nr:hydrolase, NUDIX family domain protein [Burkholderia pseudomallei MSHR5492]